MRRHHLRHLRSRENVDRWLVSYADYMTLMFALFVVLYAMAIVNKGNHTLLLDNFDQAIEVLKQNEFTNIQGLNADLSPRLYRNNLDKALQIELEHTSLMPLEINSISSQLDIAPELKQADERLVKPLEEIYIELQEVLSDSIVNQEVHLELGDEWILINLAANQMFPQGSASLLNQARDQLSDIALILAGVNNFIRIRGYTDDTVVNNEIFDSNWELSAIRAIRVLHFIEERGVSSPRLAIEGYGEYSPLKPNSNEANRQANRRVVIALSRFAWQPPLNENISPDLPLINTKVPEAKTDSKTILTVPLDGGGVRYTTRQD